MYTYDNEFAKYNQITAQMLITAYDIDDASHRENIENTLQRLLDYNVIPIINENDSVATDEIQIGDNDTLSAVVATIAKADLLILLSDIEGLYDSNPHTNKDAKLIPFVPEITDEIMALAGGAGSEFGTGGMETKLRAGRIAASCNIPMIITDGSKPERLYDIMANKEVGTLFGKREV